MSSVHNVLNLQGPPENEKRLADEVADLRAALARAHEKMMATWPEYVMEVVERDGQGRIKRMVFTPSL